MRSFDITENLLGLPLAAGPHLPPRGTQSVKGEGGSNCRGPVSVEIVSRELFVVRWKSGVEECRLLGWQPNCTRTTSRPRPSLKPEPAKSESVHGRCLQPGVPGPGHGWSRMAARVPLEVFSGYLWSLLHLSSCPLTLLSPSTNPASGVDRHRTWRSLTAIDADDTHPPTLQ